MKLKIIILATVWNFIHICILYLYSDKEYLYAFVLGMIDRFPTSVLSILGLMLPTFFFIAIGLILIDPANMKAKAIAIVTLLLIDVWFMKFMYEGFMVKLFTVRLLRLIFDILYILLVVGIIKKPAHINNRLK